VTKVALRGIAGRKARTLLTALAVILGVALVAGTYVFTDTIERAFDDLVGDTQAGIDVKVVPREGDLQTNQLPTLPADLLDRVRGVEGAALVSGALTANAVIIDKEGERLGSVGPPSLAVSAGPSEFDPFTYEGRPPRTPREVALDASSAEKAGYELGDTVRVAGNGPVRSYELVGIGSLGTASSVGGVSVAVLTLPEVQSLAGLQGRISEIDFAAAEGTTPETLRAAVAQATGRGVEVRTAAQDTAAQTADIQEGLGFLTTALLVFGVIALLVGAFSIFNTFSITVAQRTREFALLRTIGATRRQVLTVVVVEALLVGVLGSLLGLALGIALAPGLRALFEAIGIELPGAGLVIAPRTIIVALLVGTIVTLVASLAPALRATRVPPIAALREGGLGDARNRGRRRTVLGIALTALGIGVLCLGLLGGGDTTQVLTLLGVGALLVFLGVALLSPLLVVPLANLIGRPLERIGGVAGRLARGNAMRNPGRTAGTAAALMIGLALVSFTTIFADGIKASFTDSFERAVVADLVISDNAGQVPDAVAQAATQVPGVAAASSLRFSSARVAGSEEFIAGLDPRTAPSVLDVQWEEGSDATLGALGRDGVALEEQFAEDKGLQVGDTLAIGTPTDRTVRVTVRGTYSDRGGLFGPAILPAEVLRSAFDARQSTAILLNLDEGQDVAAAQRQINQGLERAFPTLESQTGEEFVDSQVGQIDQIVSLFYALLSLAVIISLFGIVNTLALSIYERTRELGLLRAIGTSRRQVRRIVRGEAIITALIGGVLGLLVGVVFAVLASIPLEEEGFVLSFPIVTLFILLVLAALAGVLAAIAPARRASRLDVLQALAYE
jgi:putative ABC transport system permease protein